MGNLQARIEGYYNVQSQILGAEQEVAESKKEMERLWTPEIGSSLNILDQFNCRQSLEEIKNQLWKTGEIRESAGYYYKYPSLAGLDRSSVDYYAPGATIGLYINYPFIAPKQNFLEDQEIFRLYWLSVSVGVTAHPVMQELYSEAAQLVIWRHKTKYIESRKKWTHPIVNDDENCKSWVLKVDTLNAAKTVKDILLEYCWGDANLSEEVGRHQEYIKSLKDQGKVIKRLGEI